MRWRWGWDLAAPSHGLCPLHSGRPLRVPAAGPSALCRVISRAPGLKLVVETLISSLRPIGNIVLICCAFFIIFGILGVQVGSPLVRGCPVRETVACGQQPLGSPRKARPRPSPCCPRRPLVGAGGLGGTGSALWMTACPVSSSRASSTTARALIPGTYPPGRSAGRPTIAGCGASTTSTTWARWAGGGRAGGEGKGVG